jgi:ankyrin repeat protein
VDDILVFSNTLNIDIDQLLMKPLILLLALFLAACGETTHENEPPSLISAAEQGNLQTLKMLLDKGDPVDTEDACQWTPLMKAALNGHLLVAKTLLEAGAELNAQDKGGYTPLLLAASNNHSDVVSLLVEEGADINHQEQSMGWTALIWASKRGHAETVSLLLEHEARLDIHDYEGKTALDWAEENQHLGIVRQLTAKSR